MLVLAARLQALAEEQASADASADRASQIRTVDRSERIRTYNYPENRIADHRIEFKAHNLDQVLDGDMDALFDALAAADKQAQAPAGMMHPRLHHGHRSTRARRWPQAGVGSAHAPTPNCWPPTSPVSTAADSRSIEPDADFVDATATLVDARRADGSRCST